MGEKSQVLEDGEDGVGRCLLKIENKAFYMMIEWVLASSGRILAKSF